MSNIKLIIENEVYDLHETVQSEFAVTQYEPYKGIEHRKLFDIDDEGTNCYIYKSVLFNGKFYLFKPQIKIKTI